jgi:hypothetical protein
MAVTLYMGIPLANYIGQSNPTGPGTWASYIEQFKNICDGHAHGPVASLGGVPLFPFESSFVGLGPWTIGTPTHAAEVAVVNTTGAGGNVIVNLPLATVCQGCLLIVKDSGAAATYHIQITRAGADLIDGANTLVISANYGVARLWAAAAGLWYTV